MGITAKDLGLVACRTCEKVWPKGTQKCGRCGARLVSRDGKSLQRVWAWWVAGILAYIPANVYPMLITTTLFQSQEDTIISGAIELAAYGSWGVAIIILTASVAIPLGKFFAIAYLALSVGAKGAMTPFQRHVIFEVVEFIGRWSMIDVFVVAVLSSLVQLSVVASINPGIASLAFALSVIFTMISAKSFDSRMIWDKVLEDEKEAEVTP
ncbi:MAG: paraquat-inducible protein A [Pseudomonadota bacterium]